MDFFAEMRFFCGWLAESGDVRAVGGMPVTQRAEPRGVHQADMSEQVGFRHKHETAATRCRIATASRSPVPFSPPAAAFPRPDSR